MNLESILFYVTHHSESIIQWVFLAILLLTCVLIGRSLFGKKPIVVAAAEPSAESGEIQQFLQRILDQTTKLEGISLEGLNPKAVADVDAQVQALKKDLAAREEEVAKLKVAGEAKPAEDSAKLTGRIEELEAKLAEYEILEDDIADLSLYKEENVRLRGELDKIRAGAPATAAPVDMPSMESMGGAPVRLPKTDTPPPVVEAVVEETEAPGDDIVAEFAQAVNQELGSGGLDGTLTETGDPMADFEAALNLEKKMTGGEAAAPPPATEAAPSPVMEAAAVEAAEVAAPVVAPAKSTGRPGEGDDLFAEFAQTPTEEEDSLDTDKMMAEMAALVGVDSSADSSLKDEDIDTDKLVLETKTFNKS